jgi:peptidoglycan hydrolase-like protein with peptidoglycan-binding domain
MFSFRAAQALLLLSALAITPAFGSRTHRAPTSGHSSKRGKKARVRGQRVIDSNRAVEIQNALIKKNYLKGAPTGQWDSQTQVAMQKYQSDHGWQTRLMPDSRALISLGLGPNHAADPVIAHAATPVSVPDPTAHAQSVEPAENTLAAVHSLSQ